MLTDDLGSVRTSITNQAGTATVAGYMGYGPFGFVQYHAGQTDTNKGYTGQYTDPLSGLDYYVARYYDPVAGLFLSADTVQSNLQGFDPYAYVGNNPETNSDPSGNFFVADPIIGRSVGSPTSSASGGFSYVPRPIIRSISAPAKFVPSGLLPITDQPSLGQAFLLAQQLAFWRQWLGKQNVRSDFAGATWYLTDQQNNGNFPFGADTLLGYHPIPWAESNRYDGNLATNSNDAEQKVLFPWLTEGGALTALLTLKLARMLGVHATLHIVLFTELPPCLKCRNFFGGMFASGMSSIGTAIMNAPPALDPWPTGETAVSLDVYAKLPSATGGNWRNPISSPSDLGLYYHQDIFFIGGSGTPPGTA